MLLHSFGCNDFIVLTKNDDDNKRSERIAYVGYGMTEILIAFNARYPT